MVDARADCEAYRICLQKATSKQGLNNFEARPVRFKSSFYLNRILKYSCASPCCAISALVLLERFQERFPFHALSSSNLQRLLLLASMTAIKYLEDDCCFHNRMW